VGGLLVESQASAFTVTPAERDHAFTAAVTACFVAGVVSSRAGNIDLAITAARRGYDLAKQHSNPGLLGFARWYWACELTSMGARTRAHAVLSEGIDDLTPAVQFSAGDTLPAEIVGMMHLQQARTAARQQRADDAHAHLDEAAHIADRVGELNGMRQHFGPTNVAAWRISIGVELTEGARAYEDATAAPIGIDALGSRERSSSLHFDFARVLAQEDGPRDGDAIRHLDTADRIASVAIRWPGTWCSTLTAALGAGYGSWTASATASVSACQVRGVRTTKRDRLQARKFRTDDRSPLTQAGHGMPRRAGAQPR
jgi:hypothetical protein